MPLLLRTAELRDLKDLAAMRHALWPDGTLEEHTREAAELLAGRMPSPLPSVILLAEDREGHIVGFIEAGLRSHADGCDPAHPLGFVEGWFVHENSRNQGTGGALMRAAEDWARSQGCREMASDTWIDHELSQHAHVSLGFEIVDRCVHFRKAL